MEQQQIDSTQVNTECPTVQGCKEKVSEVSGNPP